VRERDGIDSVRRHNPAAQRRAGAVRAGVFDLGPPVVAARRAAVAAAALAPAPAAGRTTTDDQGGQESRRSRRPLGRAPQAKAHRSPSPGAVQAHRLCARSHKTPSTRCARQKLPCGGTRVAGPPTRKRRVTSASREATIAGGFGLPLLLPLRRKHFGCSARWAAANVNPSVGAGYVIEAGEGCRR
jgi:hypothetical protein